MAIVNAPIKDIEQPLAADLQGQGLRDIPIELWQQYLSQYMKDQQGAGNAPNAAFLELQRRMQAMNQLPPQSDEGAGARSMAGKGIDLGKQINSMAEKAYGEKSTGRSETPYQDQRTNGRDKNKAAEDDTTAEGDTGVTRTADAANVPGGAGGSSTFARAPLAANPEMNSSPLFMREPGTTFEMAPGGPGAAPPGAQQLSFGGKSWTPPEGQLSNFGGSPDAMAMGRPGFDVPGPALNYQDYNLGFDPSLGGVEGGATLGGGAGGGGITPFGAAGAGLGVLGGGLGLYNAIAGKGDPMQRGLSGAAGAYGMYSGLDTLLGPTGANLYSNSLPGIGSLTKPILDSMGGAYTGAAPAAAGGAAGEFGGGIGPSASNFGAAAGEGAAAGAGAAEGAAGSAAAGAAGGVGAGLLGGAAAVAPGLAISLANLSETIHDSEENAFRGSQQYRRLMGSYLPDFLANLKTIPGQLDKLNANPNPYVGQDVYKEMNRIQHQLGDTGLENFLKSGTTYSNYGTSGGPNTIASFDFPQGPLMYAQAEPYLRMLDLGRIRGQDAAARGGLGVEGGGLSPESYGLTFGSRVYNSGANGGEGGAWSREYNPWYSANYGPGIQAKAASDEATAYHTAHPEDPAGAGYTASNAPNAYHQTPVTAGPTEGTTAGGDWVPNERQTWQPGALEALNSLTPGSYESGLAGIFGADPGAWNKDIGFGGSNPGNVGAGGTGTLGGSPLAAGGGAGGLRSGGGSDIEQNRPGATSVTSQVGQSSQDLPNPWAKKEPNIALNPLDEAMEKAKALLQGVNG